MPRDTLTLPNIMLAALIGIALMFVLSWVSNHFSYKPFTYWPTILTLLLLGIVYGGVLVPQGLVYLANPKTADRVSRRKKILVFAVSLVFFLIFTLITNVLVMGKAVNWYMIGCDLVFALFIAL